MRILLFAALLLLPFISMGETFSVIINNKLAIPLRVNAFTLYSTCIRGVTTSCEKDTVSPGKQCKVEVDFAPYNCLFEAEFSISLYADGNRLVGKYSYQKFFSDYRKDLCRAKQTYTQVKPYHFGPLGLCQSIPGKNAYQVAMTIGYRPLTLTVANADLPVLKFISLRGATEKQFDPQLNTVPTIAKGQSQGFNYFPISLTKPVTLIYGMSDAENQQCKWQYSWQDGVCKAIQVKPLSNIVSCDIQVKPGDADNLCYVTLTAKQGSSYTHKVNVTVNNQLYDDLEGSKVASDLYPIENFPNKIADGDSAQYSYTMAVNSPAQKVIFGMESFTKTPVACLLSIGQGGPCDVSACQLGAPINAAGKTLYCGGKKLTPPALIHCGVTHKKDGQTCNVALTLGLKKSITLTAKQAREHHLRTRE